MKIELKHKIKNDAFTEYVYESYDIQNKEESKEYHIILRVLIHLNKV